MICPISKSTQYSNMKNIRYVRADCLSVGNFVMANAEIIVSSVVLEVRSHGGFCDVQVLTEPGIIRSYWFYDRAVLEIIRDDE